MASASEFFTRSNYLGSLKVYWLWEVNRVQELVGSNPRTGHWMGNFTLYSC